MKWDKNDLYITSLHMYMYSGKLLEDTFKILQFTKKCYCGNISQIARNVESVQCHVACHKFNPFQVSFKSLKIF